MDRCGCYIRISTVNQKDNFSVDVQRKRAVDFCKANGFEAVLYDEQASASTLLIEEFSKLVIIRRTMSPDTPSVFAL